MKIIKNFNKSIRFTLHIASITLVIIAIIFLFIKQLFEGNAISINTYEIYTKQPVDFSILGLVDFSNVFIEFSEKNTQVNQIIHFTDQNLSAAKSLKIVAEIIMAVGVFVIISQLFNFRDIAIFASTLISIILMIILENIAIRNFVETQLITTHSKDFVTVIILLSISAFLILLEIIVKYIKIIDENKETK